MNSTSFVNKVLEPNPSKYMCAGGGKEGQQQNQGRRRGGACAARQHRAGIYIQYIILHYTRPSGTLLQHKPAGVFCFVAFSKYKAH